MFTLSQIQQAHSQVKSGSDFPKYIQDLIQLGVIKYEILVQNGQAIFFGKNDFEIRSEPKYFELEIASICDKTKFGQILKNHQNGQSDYLTFCKQTADCGVAKWIVDTQKMTCIYYDLAGLEVLAESIPQV